jgi:hypothetical protein
MTSLPLGGRSRALLTLAVALLLALTSAQVAFAQDGTSDPGGTNVFTSDLGGSAPSTAGTPSASGATIASDKADYPPGSTVYLNGTGWQPGESVRIVVDDDGLQEQVFQRDVTVVADEDGNVADTFQLPNWFVANYTVRATGEQSGVATTAFTDAFLLTASITPTSVTAGSTTQFTLSVINANTDNQATEGLACAELTLPAGYTVGATPVGTTTAPPGKSWSTTYNSTTRVIQTRASNDANALAAGQGVTFTFTATAPATTGSTQWTVTRGTKSSDCNGNQYVVSGAQPSVNVTPACTAVSVTTNPSNQTVTYGGNATFTAAANGTAPVSVQWQRSTDNGVTFNNVSGANSTTLTVTKPTVAQNGNRYRAVLTNTCSGTQTATTSAATLTVTQRDLAVSAAGVNKVYDGTADAAVTLSSDKVAGDVVALAYASASFNNEHVGLGKPVSVAGISISGADAGNYSLANTAAATTADITKRPITVTAVADEKVYDGTSSSDETPTVSPAAGFAVGVVSGDTANFSQLFDNENVGSGKTLSASGSVSDGNGGGNYEVTFVDSHDGKITQRDLAVSAAGVNKVYDGTADAAVTLSSDKVAGDVVALAYASASFNNEHVGLGKPVSVAGISISGADAGNYSLANTAAATTADITPKPLTGNFAAANKVYDGNTSATVTSRSLTGAVSLDDVSLTGGTAAFDTKDVGNGKTVTLTGATLAGADQADYHLDHVNTTTANITAWDANGHGFYQPVGIENSLFVAGPGLLPASNAATVWNAAKGGSTIPLKFNVFAGGVEKTSLSDISGFSAVKLQTCTAGAATDAVDFVTTGNTVLRYDTVDKQFIQNWKTPTVNAETCYRASVTFADGSSLSAFFKLRK